MSEDMRLSHVVGIDALPLSVTSEDLALLLRPYAEALWAFVVRDPVGHSLRFGLAQFRCADDVHRVIASLDGQTLCGCSLKVALIDSVWISQTSQIYEAVTVQSRMAPAVPAR